MLLAFSASPASAQGADTAASRVIPVVNAVLEPGQSPGKTKGGGFCLPYGTPSSKSVSDEIDSQAYEQLLSRELMESGLAVGAGAHRVVAQISGVHIDICWPSVGFDNTDKIKGTVELFVAWQFTGMDAGASPVTRASFVQKKSGAGGLKTMLRQAFVANVHELMNLPMFKAALAEPSGIAAGDTAATAQSNAPVLAQSVANVGTTAEQENGSHASSSSTSRAPADFNYGDFERLVGQTLVSDDLMIEISRQAGNVLVFQFLRPDGGRGGRYMIRPKTDGGSLELVESPFSHTNKPVARMESDGSLFLQSRDGWFNGWRVTQRIRVEGPNLVEVEDQDFINGLRIPIDAQPTKTSVFRPITEARVAAALTARASNDEADRIQAENRRREQVQREAMMDAALQGLAQGVSESNADSARADQQQADLLNSIARQTDAIQAQRRREAEAEAARVVTAARERQAAAEAIQARNRAMATQVGRQAMHEEPSTEQEVAAKAAIASQPSMARRSPSGSASSSGAGEYQTRAMAWCYRKPQSGAFLCSGPLQMMTIVGEPDLAYALVLAGCKGGDGKVPALGTSEKFDCGYMLHPNERRVPEQSPYPE